MVGPTAIGKTAEAIRLARIFDTEILSADSRQMYADMRIGTAVPSAKELQETPHHFIGFLPLDATYSAGDYGRDATEKIEKLFQTNDTLIMVGGSGLYIRAVLRGFDNLPHNPAIRAELVEMQSAMGTEALAEELRHLDPIYCATADLRNTQRVMRALEVCRASGQPYSSFISGQHKELPYDVVWVGLNTDRPALYERINCRVDLMMDAGLLDEVRSLLPQRQLNALRTVGYTELMAYLEGHCTAIEAVENIKKNTRNFAKRQITWFNKEPKIKWFRPEDTKSIDSYLSAEMS